MRIKLTLRYIALLVFGLFLFSGCSSNNPVLDEPPKEEPKPEVAPSNIEINQKIQYQTISSFQASDCWMANYIGQYWSENQKASIAKLLFSNKIEGDQPEGIALSGWRFNLGAGTANQGATSDIDDESRRAECFMQSDGSLDWNQQLGQLYFLTKAKEYGCEEFVLFANSPPVALTKNGKGYSQSGRFSNLKPDKYPAFANYIGDVLQYLEEVKGVSFKYISPINEPQYNWDSPAQEGSAWQNIESYKLIVELNKVLKANHSSTKILFGEAGSWEYLYQAGDDANRSDLIQNFFNPTSLNYIGDLSHVAPIISGHSYWVDGDWNTLEKSRAKVKEEADKFGLSLYQTEWSMLGDGYSASEFVGFDKATYLDIALYMSKVIHHDLSTANVCSWSFWTSMDLERWDHKNRFLLISTTPGGGVYSDIKQNGNHRATKTLWVLGNYSRFIRPGYSRIKLEIKDASPKLFGTAYLSPDNSQLVAVYTNLTDRSYDVRCDVKNSVNVERYTTDAINNLKRETIKDATEPIVIKSNSVVTVVYNLK